MSKQQIGIYIVIIFVSTCSYVFPQNEASGRDSLLSLLPKVEGEQKVDLLNEISAKQLLSSPGPAVDYASQALSLAKEIGYEKGIAQSYESLGNGYGADKKYQDAAENFLKASEFYQTVEDTNGKAKVLYKIGDVYENLSDYDSALKYYSEGLELSKKINNKMLAGDFLSDISVIYKYKGNFEKALQNNLQALEVYKELNSQAKIANAYGNLGNLYEAMEKYNEALSYYNKVLDISRKMNDKWKIANTQMNIGVILYDLGRKRASIEEFIKSLALFESLNDKDYMTYALTNIGAVYQELGNNEQAIKYLKRSLEISKELDKKWSVANTLINIGRLNVSIKNNTEVKKYYDEAIKISKQIGAKDLLLQAYEALSDYYSSTGNFRDALSYYKNYKEVNDSLFNDNSSKQLAEIQTKYEIASKEKEISKLKNEKAEQELIAASDRNFRNLLLVVLGGLVMIVAVITYFYRNKLNLTRQLAESNKEILQLNEQLLIKNQNLEKSEAELRQLNHVKDKFFSIIAHDLKNPFGTIIHYSEILLEDFETMNDDEKKFFIVEFKNASEQIYNLFDNLLRWSTSQAGVLEVNKVEIVLKDLVEKTFDALNLHAQKKNIKLINVVDNDAEIFADKDMVGTVIRNLVSNAIKFSPDKGEIKVDAKIINGFIEVAVQDYGIGISQEDINKLFRLDVPASSIGPSENKGTGLGLILCKEFIEKNGGSIRCESELNRGTKFVFTVKRFSKNKSAT